MENISREPIELIDDDLDAVAGGFFFINDVNIADVDQEIEQAQAFASASHQTAANASSVTQVA